MPRRRPQTQATNTNVTATDVNAPKVATPKVKKVSYEVIATVVQPEIETEILPVVEPEPVVVKEAPVTVSKKVSTDLGVVDTKEEPRPYTPHWTAPNGLILQANDPIKIEADDHGTYVVVKQDVYREVYPTNSKRPSYFLLYNKGAHVLKSTLQALN